MFLEIFFASIFEEYDEKISKLFFIIFFDLNTGPIIENKLAKISLLNFIPKMKPIKKINK